MRLDFDFIYVLVTKNGFLPQICSFFAHLIKKNNGKAVNGIKETAQTVKY